VVRNFALSALDIFGVEHSAIEESTVINSSNSESNVPYTEGAEILDKTIVRVNKLKLPP